MTRQIDDSDQMGWLHNEERLALRSDCLLRMMLVFGGELSSDGGLVHSTKGIYGACHDYVSHGNKDAGGIIAYYQANIETYNPTEDRAADL